MDPGKDGRGKGKGAPVKKRLDKEESKRRNRDKERTIKDDRVRNEKDESTRNLGSTLAEESVDGNDSHPGNGPTVPPPSLPSLSPRRSSVSSMGTLGVQTQSMDLRRR